MLCCICKEREANVHMFQIVAGFEKLQQVDLCQVCADKKGVNAPSKLSLAELLAAESTPQNSDRATQDR